MREGSFSCFLSHGSPLVISLLGLYTQAARLSVRRKARLLPLPVRTRAAPSSRTAPVSRVSPKSHSCTSSPCVPPPARHRRPTPDHSPRNSRDDVGVSPRAAAETRQESASPPSELGERWRPLRRTQGHALGRTVPTQRTPPRLPSSGRIRPRRQIFHIRPSPLVSVAGRRRTLSDSVRGAAGDDLVR